jgi:hypothetical protein
MSKPDREMVKVTLRPDGRPFQSDVEAMEHVRANSLRNVRPYPYRGGWALAAEGLEPEEVDPQKKVEKADQAASADAVKRERDSEKFFRVTVHGSADTNGAEPPQILLADGNYYLTVIRGAQVILPASLVEVLDHAVSEKFTVVPGYGRKVAAGNVPRFPYTRHGEASRKEFLEFLRTGNARRDQELRGQEAEALAGLSSQT